MNDVVDLANSEVEPTDEQLQGLATRAFQGVKSAREAALIRVREEIARVAESVLRDLEQRLATNRVGE
jgi:hypothetical protein